MILGADGEKMSKSRGNVVNPDEIVAEIGADAFRLYEMFMGAFDQAIPWSTDGARGCRRFLDRVWRMMEFMTEDDKVKLIFLPCYLTGDDGIINKTYYDVVLGNDLCIYPSYYEPWGYTPLEAVAFKVPCITTDLAGFVQASRRLR